MTGMKVGFALCGSFCTIDKALIEMERLVKEGAEIIPIAFQVRHGQSFQQNQHGYNVYFSNQAVSEVFALPEKLQEFRL